MAIKKPIPITFNLDSHNSVQSVCSVIHIDDKNTETLDLSLLQGGEHIKTPSNSTVTARFVRVKDKILISDNVPCAVQENGNIHIPIDNAAAHMLVGEIKIEVNIVDENDILTMQFPLVIKVNNTILADAEISPESEGTIPELLEEAREAAESATQAAKAATEAISTKQDKLTAGKNITIDDNNVISAEGGGVTSYEDLTDKPQINGVTLSGNKISTDLGLQGRIGNYFTVENNEYLEYNFNSIPLPSSNSVMYCIPFTRIRNFPSSLSDKVVQSGILYIFHYVHDTGGAMYIIRRIMGMSPSGNYVEFVQYCTVATGDTAVIAQTDWVELTGGGAQIVSGVVNANGTITFTDSDGNSFTTSGESVIGADGFSPSATVQQTASGATITVTDKSGTTTANISNGAPGQDYILTAQDKTDIANIVLSELPTTEGVLYGNQSN